MTSELWVALIGVTGTIVVALIAQLIGAKNQKNERAAEAEDRANERSHVLEVERTRLAEEARQDSQRRTEQSAAERRQALEGVAINTLEAITAARTEIVAAGQSISRPDPARLAALASALRRVPLYIDDPALRQRVDITVSRVSDWWKNPRADQGVEDWLDETADMLVTRFRDEAGAVALASNAPVPQPGRPVVVR